jgi:hypothetical protein
MAVPKKQSFKKKKNNFKKIFLKKFLKKKGINPLFNKSIFLKEEFNFFFK